ncbi:MAG: hypothetical protein GY815_04235 [Gammaproteobacteria bacterium]|nr:hypothetical protein [Gammaproteobacteria bacterium]
MSQKTFSFPLLGGLDLTTPAATVKPGMCLSSNNYEPNDGGGYRRLAGYERYDGQPAPSSASYWVILFDSGIGNGFGNPPTPGATIDGGTSGATGTLHLVVTEWGVWGDDAAGYLVLFDVTGAFQDNETLDVAAAPFALAASVEVERGADADDLDREHLIASQEARRALIAAVPGEGPVRGVWMYNGVQYAFRNAVGGATGVMYASTSLGWAVALLGDYLDFSAGVTEFLEGEVITAAPSGATAVVVAVGVTSGSWSGSDAAGRIYIKTITGTFTASDTLTSTSGVADCDSAATAVTLPPGGKYDFRNYNFGGAVATNYMWGCNGAGRGFRYDGTNFAFIHVTGLSDAIDKPEHLHAHKKHLFFSFQASLQHSGIGTPMVWNAVFGAAELSTGDRITGLRDQPGDILAIFNRNRTYLLYGDDVDNWSLVNFSFERGAIEWSMQDLGWSFYGDDRGIQNLSQTDAYGDLKQGSISERIDPLYQRQKQNIVDSIRIKSKNQYRLFFDDNSGVLLRWDNDPGHRGGYRFKFMRFTYLHKVESIVAEECEVCGGAERVFFGSDDGFVYEAEKGESFDGENIEYFLRLVFAHCGSPRQKKAFRKATIQIDAPDVPVLRFSPEFGYGAPDQPPPGVFNFPDGTLNVGGGIWDIDLWGDFIWDGQIIGEAQAYIDGQGINVSLLIQGESSFERAHTLQSITYNYSPRGLKR